MNKIRKYLSVMLIACLMVGCGAAQAAKQETTVAAEPAAELSAEPAAEPSAEPAAEPSEEPAAEPTAEPTSEPAAEPAQAAETAETATTVETTVILEDGREYKLSNVTVSSVTVQYPSGTELEYNGTFPDTQLPSGRVEIKDLPIEWQNAVRGFAAVNL